MPQHDRTIAAFLSALGSREATPGGGSASALLGAIGAALCGMVGRLNDQKDGTPGPLHDTIARADTLCETLAWMIDEDISAFEGLAATWKLPADDPAAAAKKLGAVIRATNTPLGIMQASLDVMRLAVEGSERSKKNCRSDAGVAAVAAHAALEGARLNVMINLPSLTDESIRAKLLDQANRIRSEGAALRKQIDTMLDG